MVGCLVAKIALSDGDQGDAVIRDATTGRALKQKLNFGRPDWDKEFATLQAHHAGKDIGVFFCGPKAISTQLHTCSNKFTSSDTRFFYHKVLYCCGLLFFFHPSPILPRPGKLLGNGSGRNHCVGKCLHRWMVTRIKGPRSRFLFS